MSLYFTPQQLDLEIQIWHTLHHENVLPLHGIASGFGHYTAMVSPWMENGSLTIFLGREEQATLSTLDRLRLVSRHYRCLFFDV
jgi:hypothetical protein